MALGNIISAVGGIAGGLLGQRSQQDDAKHAAQDAVRFAKNSIRWRVDDAKRAGIHPLYALGAAGASAPQFIPGQSPLGSSIRDAAAQIGHDVNQAPIQKAQTDLLKAQTRVADAQADALSKSATPPPPSPQTEGAQTFPIDYEPERRTPEYDKRFIQGLGWVRQTPEGVRMDFTEAIGPDLDAYLIAADRGDKATMDRIKQKYSRALATAADSLKPQWVDKLRSKMTDMFEWHARNHYKNRRAPYNAPTPFKR